LLSGRDKGRTGEVFEVHPAADRALVRGINMVRRHQKQTGAQEGGIISKESSIHLSNLAYVGRTANRRASDFKIHADGKKAALPRAREQRSMAETAYVPRLRAEYDKTIRSQLTEKFGYANVMQVPRLDKVCSTWALAKPSTTARRRRRRLPICR